MSSRLRPRGGDGDSDGERRKSGLPMHGSHTPTTAPPHTHALGRRQASLYEAAAFIAVLHALYVLLAQLECFVVSIYPTGKYSMITIIPRLFVHNFEVWFIAAILGFGSMFAVEKLPRFVPGMTRHGAARLVAFITLGIHFFIAVDQVAYKKMFRHLSMGMTEGGVRSNILTQLFGSFVTESDWCLLVNLIAMLVFAPVQIRSLMEFPFPFVKTLHVSVTPKSFRGFLLGCLAVSGLWCLRYCGNPSLGSTTMDVFNDAERHPLAVLLFNVEDFRKVDPILPSAGNVTAGGLDSNRAMYSLIYGQEAPQVRQEQPAFTAFLQEVQRRNAESPPNILLFVHEGLGAHNALNETGHVYEKMMPNLARLQNRGSVTFTQIHTYFPSTLRSWVPLITGGYTGTQGGIVQQVRHVFTGPHVVSGLKTLGYRAGFFGSGALGFEKLDDFFKTKGFDAYFDFAEGTEEWRTRHKLSGWGAADDATSDVAVKWIRKEVESDPKRPLLLVFFPCGTHHPYKTPASYTGPKIPAPNVRVTTNYATTVHFVDGVMQSIVDRWSAALREHGAGDRDPTVIVSADHGESFGWPHVTNHLHKNFLYEENVRTFLLVSPGGKRLRANDKQRALISHRIARHSDFLYTLFDMTGPNGLHKLMVRPADTPAVFTHGQSLLSPFYTTPVCYFHKTAPPHRWGMLDGKWKYICAPNGQDPELYDLSVDPTEQINLASRHPTMVDTYQSKVSQWFVVVHCDWVHQLKGGMWHYACGKNKKAGKSGKPGPTALLAGAWIGGKFNPYGQGAKIPPKLRSIVMWSQWTPYEKDHKVFYEIERVVPRGERHYFTRSGPPMTYVKSKDFSVKAGWHTTRYNLNLQGVPAAGEVWEARIIDSNTAKVLISQRLEVDSSISLPQPAPKSRLRKSDPSKASHKAATAPKDFTKSIRGNLKGKLPPKFRKRHL